MRAVSCRPLSDERLIDFLRLEEDRVPRGVADEIVGRADRLRPLLARICADDLAWRADGPAFWLPVHAAYLLAAMGGPASLPGLLDALRASARHDVDWVWERMPCLLGAVGRPAVRALRERAFDPRGAERERVVAVHALAAVAARHPVEQGEILDLLRGAVENEAEDAAVRGAAGLALLAFARPGDRAAALAEAARQRRAGRRPAFEGKDVEAAYGRGGPDTRDYTADWMAFYDPERIEERRRRWREREEDLRWARGASANAAWVERECARFLRIYEASLVDLDDETRGDAVWVAESMAEYLTRHEGRAPWRWNGPMAYAYLVDSLARRLRMDGAGRAVALPDAMRRFVRHCWSEGRLVESEAREAERRIEGERAGFLRALTDPRRRSETREAFASLLARGVDPAHPDREAGAAPRLIPSLKRP